MQSFSKVEKAHDWHNESTLIHWLSQKIGRVIRTRFGLPMHFCCRLILTFLISIIQNSLSVWGKKNLTECPICLLDGCLLAIQIKLIGEVSCNLLNEAPTDEHITYLHSGLISGVPIEQSKLKIRITCPTRRTKQLSNKQPAYKIFHIIRRRMIKLI